MRRFGMGSKKRQRLAFRALDREYRAKEGYTESVYSSSGKELKNVIMHMAKKAKSKEMKK